MIIRPKLMTRTWYRRWGKSAIDRIAALLGLLVLSPVIAALALLVRVKLGSPVFFVQQRPGQYARPFRMLKFRTMTDARGPDGELLPDADRLVSFGRFLRSTSLDELPELVNVLRGEMSLVGPRPLLMHYLPLYDDFQHRRHEVKPGITGWAQVNGRNQAHWEDRFRMDVWYVDHMSLKVDCAILARTIAKVAKREGVNQEGEATVEYFTGNVCVKQTEW
jgi:lipopolysaccharide/colanic/teichoic acid biosynthesis glycosyltransferase